MTSTGSPPQRVDGLSSRPRRPLELPLLLLPLAVVIFAARVPLSDPDGWWHLRAGELISEKGLVSDDPWSYASAHPWLLHEWLSELVMYGAYALGGYPGVALLRALLLGAIVAVVLWSCRRVASPDVASVVAALATIAILPAAAERPQLVSWVVLAALCPWLRSRFSERRPPWALVPIVWLWANLHGLWLVAVVLYVALIIGLAVELGRPGLQLIRRFALVGLAAAVVPAVTPVGPRLLLAPFHVREYAQFVSEWAPPSITSPHVASAVALAAIVVVGWARRQTAIDAPTIAFVVAATGVGLTYSRTVPVLAIALAPLAAQTVHGWTTRELPAFGLTRNDRRVWGIAGLAGLLAVAVSLPATAVPDPVKSMSDRSGHAMSEVSKQLDELPGRARVLNEYDLGGWLIWTARDSSVVVDGRAEIYTIDHFKTYRDALSMRPGWRDFITSMRPDAALLYEWTPLVEGLKSLGWTVASDNDGVLVLLPPS